nr:MAG TPA: tail protein [Caudoviricetes sp.]
MEACLQIPYYEPRVFTVSGTILADSYEEMIALKNNLTKKCRPKDKLQIHYCNGVKTYYAEAETQRLPQFFTRLKNLLPFQIDIRIPEFYWMSENEEINNIFETEKRLTNSTAFPAVFSVRKSESIITNDGDANAWPHITILCETPNQSNISVINATTGNSFILQYAMCKGERIEIDMKNKTVISDLTGNLINKVDRMNAFWAYEQGANKIICNADGRYASIYIVSRHRTLYAGV